MLDNSAGDIKGRRFFQLKERDVDVAVATK